MRLKRFLSCVILFLFCVFCLHLSSPALAEGSFKDSFNKSLDAAADAAGINKNTTNPIQIAGNVIKIVLSMLGVIFLVLMIYGGFIWMTARGNEQEVQKAKDIIKNAIIGLVIVVGAYAISSFVVGRLTEGTMK